MKKNKKRYCEKNIFSIEVCRIFGFINYFQRSMIWASDWQTGHF